MKLTIKSLSAAVILSAFAATSQASDLKVFSSTSGSIANIVVWSGNQPVSGGSVTIKNHANQVIARGTINSHGRAHLRMPSGYGQFTVTAESSSGVGSSLLTVDDRQIGR